MALQPSWPGPNNAASTTAARKNLAGLIVTDAAGVVRSGVFPDSTGPLVVGRSDMNVDVLASRACAVQFGGPVLLSNDGTIQLPSPLASPVSGINYYVVYVKQNESTSPGTDANNNTVAGAVLSTSSFAAARATLPTGAEEYSTVQIPSGVASTLAGGVVITPTHRFTAAAGGVVLLRNQAEQAAWAPADGALARRIDTGVMLVRHAGAWAAAPGASPEINLVAAATQTAAATATVAIWAPPGTGPSVSTGAEWFTVSGGDIIVKNAGRYRITGRVLVGSASGQAIAFYLNSSGGIISQDAVSTLASMGVMAKLDAPSVYLAANTVVNIIIAATTGGLSLGGGSPARSSGEFSIRYLGPA